MKPMPWTDRTWSFDLPAPMFPFLVERLRGTPARLEDRVRGLDDVLLHWREGDAWSIQEQAGHLLDTEALWHARLDDYLSGAPSLRPAEHRGPVGHDPAVLGSLVAAFRASRMDMIRRLEELTDGQIERAAHHPRLNRPMRVIDMAQFAAEHDDHHLARISELIRIFHGTR